MLQKALFRWSSHPETTRQLLTNSTKPGVTEALSPSGHQEHASSAEAKPCACGPGRVLAAGKMPEESTAPQQGKSLGRQL